MITASQLTNKHLFAKSVLAQGLVLKTVDELTEKNEGFAKNIEFVAQELIQLDCLWYSLQCFSLWRNALLKTSWLASIVRIKFHHYVFES